MNKVRTSVLTILMALSLSASVAVTSGHPGDATPKVFSGPLPAGYREWRLISVAHQEGSLDDLRAILGNDAAIIAARDAKLPFPDGAIIARLAWSCAPLEESIKAFGHTQSYEAGQPKNGVQVMVKDSVKYASSGGEVLRSLMIADLSNWQ